MFHKADNVSLGDASARTALLRAFIRRYRGPLRRFLVIAAISFWLGGFTFYASVAVPIGADVLGSHRIQGFITQQVTNWLNVAGACALPILFWNAIVSSRGQSRLLRFIAIATLIAMSLIEIELLILHPVLDRLLVSSPHRAILNDDRFDFLHRVYLFSTTAQWFIGLLHVWCVCILWGRPADVRRETTPH